VSEYNSASKDYTVTCILLTKGPERQRLKL